MKNLSFYLLSFVLLIFMACNTPSSPNADGDQQQETTENTDVSASSPQTQSSEVSATQTYKGLLYVSKSQQWLRLCEKPSEYFLLKDETGTIEGQYTQNRPKLLYPNEPIIATLTGNKFLSDTLKPPFTALLQVTKVEEVLQKNFKNICIPYEYWGLGNEPFWSLEISAREGLIVFKTTTTLEAIQFPYAFPKEKGNALVYETQREDRGNLYTLKAVIKEQPCSDTMSDTDYSYSLEVTYNGDTYKGCAVKGEIIDQSQKYQLEIKK